MSKEELNKKWIKTFFQNWKEFFKWEKIQGIQIIHEVDNRSYSELISGLMDFENNWMNNVIHWIRAFKKAWKNILN